MHCAPGAARDKAISIRRNSERLDPGAVGLQYSDNVVVRQGVDCDPAVRKSEKDGFPVPGKQRTQGRGLPLRDFFGAVCVPNHDLLISPDRHRLLPVRRYTEAPNGTVMSRGRC